MTEEWREDSIVKERGTARELQREKRGMAREWYRGGESDAERMVYGKIERNGERVVYKKRERWRKSNIGKERGMKGESGIEKERVMKRVL